MTKSYFILAFLTLWLFELHGQKNDPCKIRFQTDTVRQGEGYRMFGSIQNRKDTAFLNFDGGFKGDTILVILDGKTKYTQIFESDFSTGYAGSIAVPKTNKMVITIKLNGQSFGSFKFNKDFCITHINYYDKIMSLTYTNQIYVYE